MKMETALSVLSACCEGNALAAEAYVEVVSEIKRLRMAIDDLAQLTWDGCWPTDLEEVMSGAHETFLNAAGKPLKDNW